MTAAVIVQLAHEGKLKYSDPVSNYVAGVPNGDHITIAELLEMRSGLYNVLNAPELSESADHDMTKVWTPAELLAIAFAHPPNFSPDADYEYSNTNYVLLGLIIEKIEGKRLAEAMQDRLFGPLGLQHTELPPSNVNAIPHRTPTDTCAAVPRSPSLESRRIRTRSRPRPPLGRLSPPTTRG